MMVARSMPIAVKSHKIVTPEPENDTERCPCQTKQTEDVRWLALTLRRSLIQIVKAIDARYPADERQDNRAA